MHLLVPFIASSALVAIQAVTLISFDKSMGETDLVCEWVGKAFSCKGVCDAAAGAFPLMLQNRLETWMVNFPDIHVVRNDTGRLVAHAWNFETEFGRPCTWGNKAFCCSNASSFSEVAANAWTMVFTRNFFVRPDYDGVLRSVKTALPHWAIEWNINHGGEAFVHPDTDMIDGSKVTIAY